MIYAEDDMTTAQRVQITRSLCDCSKRMSNLFKNLSLNLRKSIKKPMNEGGGDRIKSTTANHSPRQNGLNEKSCDCSQYDPKNETI